MKSTNNYKGNVIFSVVVNALMLTNFNDILHKHLTKSRRDFKVPYQVYYVKLRPLWPW